MRVQLAADAGKWHCMAPSLLSAHLSGHCKQAGLLKGSPISTLPCFVRRWCVRHPMHQHQSRRHLQRLDQPWCVAKCMLAGAAGGRPQQGSSMYTCVQGTMSHTPEICRHKPPCSPSCPLLQQCSLWATPTQLTQPLPIPGCCWSRTAGALNHDFQPNSPCCCILQGCLAGSERCR